MPVNNWEYSTKELRRTTLRQISQKELIDGAGITYGATKDQDAKLAEMAFATHTTTSRSTRFTPAQLNFGKEFVFPLGNNLRCTDPAGLQLTSAQYAVRPLYGKVARTLLSA